MMAVSKFNLIISLIAALGVQLSFAKPAKSQDNAVIDSTKFPFVIPLAEDALHVLYFYHQRPTGVASNELSEAIKAFQKQNGMPPTGQLTNTEFSNLLEQVDQYKFSQITIDPLEGVGGSPMVGQTENLAYASGSWVIPDDDKDFPLNVSKISCDKAERVCHEVFAWLAQPTKSGFGSPFRAGPFAGGDRKTGSTHLYLSIDTYDYDIRSWSQYELIADRQTPTGCGIMTLTIRFQAKDITYKDVPTSSCSESILRNRMLNRPIIAKMMDGTAAQKSFYEKKHKETGAYLMKQPNQ